MQNFLVSCLALGIIAGGFALTGDLGWIAGRGLRVIQAANVPDDEASAPVTASSLPSSAELAPHVPMPVNSPRSARGPERIELASTRPGQRILVWLDDAAAPLPIDVVDPGSAGVILHHGPPRRATISAGAIVRGEQLRVVDLGLAHAGTAAARSLGRIVGIDVGR